jgi:hypothetical protein
MSLGTSLGTTSRRARGAAHSAVTAGANAFGGATAFMGALGSPLLAAADGRQGHPNRPAARRRRGFPGPASVGTGILPTPHEIPVPTPAHPTPRAIRVLRSPR